LANHKPRNLSRGGFITYQKGDRINPDHENEDTILSLLETNSLVVPRPAVKYLSDYKGKFTCGKIITDETKLIPTVVMPDEIVVCSHYANDVVNHLKKKGITLPLSDDNYR
jgi:hypothetical protein